MLVLYLIEYMFDNGLILSQANIDRLKFKQAILVSLILLGFIIALIVLFELRGLLNNDFQLVILNNVN
ncbi:putative amino-acid permease membrane protein [Ligilactobacillus equi DPC 6820]|nr:putative amino-acid permease membrane protein [Ligilactobacillus equi DPC 6820]